MKRIDTTELLGKPKEMNEVRFRVLVLSDDSGWQPFGAGFFLGEEGAQKQCTIFQASYPDRKFTVMKYTVRRP